MKIASILAILKSVFIRNRSLVIELSQREISERYAGSIFGSFWAILTPVVIMSVYVGLFAFVFPVRSIESGSPIIGAALILSGLVPWLAFVDVATRAPSVFVSQRALVRQVVFPIEVLPARSICSSLVSWCVGSVIALLVALFAGGAKATWLLIPLLWVLQFLAMFGVVCFLAVLGAWMRDLREIVSILANIGLYAAPILLLPSTIAILPTAAKWLITLNPFSHMVLCYHDSIVYGRFEHPVSWVAFPLLSVISFFFGTAIFARARPHIAEVL